MIMIVIMVMIIVLMPMLYCNDQGDNVHHAGLEVEVEATGRTRAVHYCCHGRPDASNHYGEDDRNGKGTCTMRMVTIVITLYV